MGSPKITVLVNFSLDFQEQLEHVKKRGVSLSEYIRGCVRANREHELSTEIHDKPPQVAHTLIIQEAVKNNFPGFCGGFISSIMLNKLLNGVSRSEQRDALHVLGYISHPALPLNRTPTAVLPDHGCPRLYVHQQSDARNITTPGEVAKRYIQTNTGGVVRPPGQILRRIKKAIQNGQPGFYGGFISLPHVTKLLDYELNEKDIQQIQHRFGYHPHPTSLELLVKDGNVNGSLDAYHRANTFVSHTKPLNSIEELGK